jgi:spore coat polysaccharide biosynthesis protein SpsF (cytidylyltransferase family)
MNALVISQARMGSKRLPNKVLMEINGKSLLKIHVERISKSKQANKHIIATTINKEDDAIENWCNENKITCFRGNSQDVLDRYYQCAKLYNPLYIVRLTADCPLIDAQLVDEVILFAKKNNLDYASNTLVENFPDGEDVEIMTLNALEAAWEKANIEYMREHVTPFIRENGTFSGGSLFKTDNYSCHKNYGNVRLTVDEPADFEVIKELIKKEGIEAGWETYALSYINNNSINSVNSNIARNEGFKK